MMQAMPQQAMTPGPMHGAMTYGGHPVHMGTPGVPPAHYQTMQGMYGAPGAVPATPAVAPAHAAAAATGSATPAPGAATHAPGAATPAPGQEAKAAGGSSHQRHEPIVGDVIEDRAKNRPLKRYKTGPKLGKGGFATCYQLTSFDTGRVYAGKVIPKVSVQSEATRRKLHNEIRIHRSLAHRNVVRFERYFEDPNNIIILLELCSQQTLMELVKRRQTLTETEVQCFMWQLVNVVFVLHANNVIHRDLKLGNLFLDGSMEIKLGDFGLATRLDHPSERKKTICGTPNYIAPEILDAKHPQQGHSFEVDIWAIGVIAYTMLYGRPPFESKSVKATYERIRSNQYELPTEPYTSDAAKSFITSILSSRPESRPSLETLRTHAFFSQSPFPVRLSPSTHSTPLAFHHYRHPVPAGVAPPSSLPFTPQVIAPFPDAREFCLTNSAAAVAKAPSATGVAAVAAAAAAAGESIDENAAPAGGMTAGGHAGPGHLKPAAPQLQQQQLSTATGAAAPPVYRDGTVAGTTGARLKPPLAPTASVVPQQQQQQLPGPADKFSPAQVAATAGLGAGRSAQPFGIASNAAVNGAQAPVPVASYQTAGALDKAAMGRPAPGSGEEEGVSRPVSALRPVSAAPAPAPAPSPSASRAPSGGVAAPLVAFSTAPATVAAAGGSRPAAAGPIAPAATAVLASASSSSSSSSATATASAAAPNGIRILSRVNGSGVASSGSSVGPAAPADGSASGVSAVTASLDALSLRPASARAMQPQPPPPPPQQQQQQGSVEPVSAFAYARQQQQQQATAPAAAPVATSSSSSSSSRSATPSLRRSTSPSRGSSRPPSAPPAGDQAAAAGSAPAVAGSAPAPAPALRPVSAAAMAATASTALSAGAASSSTAAGAHLQLVPEADVPAIWVNLWVDYTSKYGMGYLLSDGSCGVYFNDMTKIILHPNASDVQYIWRRSVADTTASAGVADVVADYTLTNFPPEMNKKITLLQHFQKYLINHRTTKQGGDAALATSAATSSTTSPQPLVYVKKWLRTEHAILFRLSNRTIQVIFFDQTEIVLNSERRVVSYTDKRKHKSTYSLDSAFLGERPDLQKRMKYAKDVIAIMLSRVAGAPFAEPAYTVSPPNADAPASAPNAPVAAAAATVAAAPSSSSSAQPAAAASAAVEAGPAGADAAPTPAAAAAAAPARVLRSRTVPLQ